MIKLKIHELIKEKTIIITYLYRYLPKNCTKLRILNDDIISFIHIFLLPEQTPNK